MNNAKRVKKMRKLLGGGSSVDKGTVVDLKRKVAKGFKNSEDEIAYLKNRLAIEENSRKQAEDILTKLVMCKVNSERIDKLEKRIEKIEKRLDSVEDVSKHLEKIEQRLNLLEMHILPIGG